MNTQKALVLNIDSLYKDIPVISKAASGFYKENCMVSFHLAGHSSGVRLAVVYQETNHTFEVEWEGNITEQLINNYNDLEKVTEFAACTVALLLIRDITEYTTIRQSAKGTGIDYFLGTKNQSGDLIFNDTARLEVSGILKENEGNTVDQRIKSKINRLPDIFLPTVIVIVEFSQPWSKMVKHE